ncbi:hypothetical protein, partial [Jutongia sp.]
GVVGVFHPLLPMKSLIFLIIAIVIVIAMIVTLCFIIFSKSRTKSDYDKSIEDDEQMNYIKKRLLKKMP